MSLREYHAFQVWFFLSFFCFCSQLGFEITKSFFNQLITWCGRKESREPSSFNQTQELLFLYWLKCYCLHRQRSMYTFFTSIPEKWAQKYWHTIFILFLFFFFLNILSCDIEKDCKEVKKWSIYDFSGLLRLFRIKVNLRTWLVLIISMTHC